MKKYIIISIIVVFPVISAVAQVSDKFLIKAAMLANVGQFEDASVAINQVTSTDNKIYTKTLADIQFGLKNYQQAIDLYNKLETNSPGTYQIELSRSYARLGNMAKAMEHLEKYFQQKNKMPISKIVNDEAFADFKNNAQWQNLWQKVDYSEPELKVNQVNAAAEMGYNDYMNNVLEEALRKYPSNPELLYHQSKYFTDKKMYDAASKAINQALSKSGHDKYYYQKSQVEQKNHHLKEALTSINEAIKRNPAELRYYTSRIEINRSLGNTDEANKDVQFIAFCLPDSPEVQLAQIKIEADKGNYLTAIDGLDDLIVKDQSNREYFVLRGKMDLKVQRLQDADEDFGMALDLNPQDAEANLGKGIAKHQLDDTTAACYYWQKAANEGSREAIDYLNKFCGK